MSSGNTQEISNESRSAAHNFATRFSLSQEVEDALAELLEQTWHEGVRAEQTFAFLDSIHLEKVR